MFFKLRNLYYCAALLIQLALVTQQLVPYSGATRFVPNWWTAGNQPFSKCVPKIIWTAHFCFVFFIVSKTSAFNQNIKASYLLSSSSSGRRRVSQFRGLLSRRVLRPLYGVPAAPVLFAAASDGRSLSTRSKSCWSITTTSSLFEPLSLRQRPRLPWNSRRMGWCRMCCITQSSWPTSPLFPPSHFERYETAPTAVE